MKIDVNDISYYLVRGLFSLLPFTDSSKNRARWNHVEEKLKDGIGHCKEWKTLNIDADSKDHNHDDSWKHFEEIEAVVNAAWDGKKSDPKASLWHWAARHNKSWLVSQFLKDPVACETLMASDSQDHTALDVAIEAGSTAVTELFFADPRVVKAELTKLSIADLLKACRGFQPNFEMAKQILREKLTTLKKLDLANAQLTAADLTTLVEIVENNGQTLPLVLQQINLAQNGLNDNSLDELFSLFQSCSATLRTLNLASNKITSKGITGLIKLGLLEFKNLYSLDVLGNSISKTCFNSLEEGCKPKRIDLAMIPPASSNEIKSVAQIDTSQTTSGKAEIPASPVPSPITQLPAPQPAPVGSRPSASSSNNIGSSQFKLFPPVHEIAEMLINVIHRNTGNSQIGIQNKTSDRKITIELYGNLSDKNSRNKCDVLLKTLELLQLTEPRKMPVNAPLTININWSALSSKHADLCTPIFERYCLTIAVATSISPNPNEEQMNEIFRTASQHLMRIYEKELREIKENKVDMHDSKTVSDKTQVPIPR